MCIVAILLQALSFPGPLWWGLNFQKSIVTSAGVSIVAISLLNFASVEIVADVILVSCGPLIMLWSLDCQFPIKAAFLSLHSLVS